MNRLRACRRVESGPPAQQPDADVSREQAAITLRHEQQPAPGRSGARGLGVNRLPGRSGGTGHRARSKLKRTWWIRGSAGLTTACPGSWGLAGRWQVNRLSTRVGDRAAQVPRAQGSAWRRQAPAHRARTPAQQQGASHESQAEREPGRIMRQQVAKA